MSERPIVIQRKMRELGRIRLGKKGSRGQPEKLTKFRLTSASDFLLQKAAEQYGGTVRPWTDAPDEGMFELYTEANELEVLLVPTIDDRGGPSFAYSQYYELWTAGGCKRRCDGTTELISDEACLCDPDDRKCQITTRAQLMLPRIPSLGVWRLETKGFYAASELPGIFDLLASFAQNGRPLPAVLRIEQRSVKRQKENGSGVETRRFIVPVIDLPGVTLAEAAPTMMTFNAPALPPSEKPALGAGSQPLPDDNEFDGKKDPGFGSPPPLPNGGAKQKASTSTKTEAKPKADEEELFPDGDKAGLSRKIFAQCKGLGIDEPERHVLQLHVTGEASLKDMDVEQLQKFSKWLASASADDITAALAGSE